MEPYPVLTISPDTKLDFSDVLLEPRCFPLDGRPVPKSRADIDLLKKGAVPVIVANMDTIGTFEMASHVLPYRLMVAILKDYTPSEWERAIASMNLDPSLLIPTLGLRDLDAGIERMKDLVGSFPSLPMVCLDVANGYLHSVADAVARLADALPDTPVCAGNIVNLEGLEHLATAGARVVKVGIGSGGVCLTRKMTGVGFPQFSAIHDLAPRARDLGVELISDGGMTVAGDVAKAMAAGASYVMAGSYFAGHEETGIRFHGMSSDRSRSHRNEDIADYRASEGREVLLASRGSLAHTLRALLGGIRSSCMYVGVRRLEEMPRENLRAVEVRRQLNRIEGVQTEGEM